MESREESDSRIGSVELEAIALTQEPHLEDSVDFKKMADRLEVSEEVFLALQRQSGFHLEQLLTDTLRHLVAEGGLDGMMIASSEGFLIAPSAGLDQGDILAAIGSLFESTVGRAQNEGLIAAFEEMSLTGFNGERIAVRYFPNLDREWFLVAYSRSKCTCRPATSRALKLCGELLTPPAGHSPRKLANLVSRINSLRPTRDPRPTNQNTPAGNTLIETYSAPTDFGDVRRHGDKAKDGTTT